MFNEKIENCKYTISQNAISQLIIHKKTIKSISTKFLCCKSKKSTLFKSVSNVYNNSVQYFCC
jgi:hypothetical protein